jgi:hypothetical protein
MARGVQVHYIVARSADSIRYRFRWSFTHEPQTKQKQLPKDRVHL